MRGLGGRRAAVVGRPASPGSVDGAVIVAALIGLLFIASAGITIWNVAGWARSAMIQAGPRTLGVVIAAGPEVQGSDQQATLEYWDARHVRRLLTTGFPLGLLPNAAPINVQLGMSTTVTYDPAHPGTAEIWGHPAVGGAPALLSAAASAILLAGVVSWLGLRDRRRATGVLRAHSASWVDPPTIVPPSGGSWSWSHPTPGPETVAPAMRWALRSRRLSLAGSGLTVLTVVLAYGGAAAARAQLDYSTSPPVPTATGAPAPMPPVLTAPAPATGPLVTPDIANAVVEAVWPIRDRALVVHDLATLQELEAGPALSVDVGRMSEGIAPNRVGGSGVNTSRLEPGEFNTFVPRQSAWPLDFLAQVGTFDAGRTWFETMVFVRDGPALPWVVMFDTGYAPPGTGLPVLLDAEGYDPSPTVSWIAATDVVPSVARYWQSWVVTGAAPRDGPRFADGLWTSTLAASLAGKQDKVADNGINAHFTFGDDPPPPTETWAFGVGPNEFVCSPIHETVVYAGANQDDHLEKWGNGLAPGNYRSVTDGAIRETCVYVPGAAGAPLSVLGADKWLVSQWGRR